MIQKIKGLLGLKEDITAVNKKVEEQNSAVEELKANVKELCDSVNLMGSAIKSFRDEQGRHLEHLEQSSGRVNVLCAEFEEQIKDFKLKKTQMQERMMETADNELRESLDRVRADVASYNELKVQINQITKDITSVRAEIGKFNAISRHLRENDFELSKYAKHLAEMDTEKLRLMKKIDTLERLCAKQRRSLS